MTELNESIDTRLKEQGASFLGFADLAPAHDYIRTEFGDDLLHYPRAVVLGLAYPREVVNQLMDGPTHTYLYYYNVLNRKLDEMALLLADWLQDQGYQAFPIPASQRVGDQRLSGIFSHRLAANLAGLGWVGKSSNFIHPEYGPRHRLVTILTDAPLTTGQPVENRCGTCQACREACPADAITGKAFAAEDALEERFLGQRCDEHLSRVRSAFGKRVCGKCLAACPYGKKGRGR